MYGRRTRTLRGLRGILKGCSSHVHCRFQLLCNRFGSESADDLACNNAPNSISVFAEGGHSAHPQDVTNSNRNTTLGQQFCHRKQQMCVSRAFQAAVMTDGPPATPLLADPTFRQNFFSLRLNAGTVPGNSGMGSRGRAGLLFNSLSLLIPRSQLCSFQGLSTSRQLTHLDTLQCSESSTFPRSLRGCVLRTLNTLIDEVVPLPRCELIKTCH